MPLKDILLHLRRSPLRRRSDLAEAWMVLATGALIAVAAPAAGLTAANAVQAAGERQSQDRQTVSAVLTENPPDRIGVDTMSGVTSPVHATVRWTATNGAVHTGETEVAPHLRAGDRTTAWLDGRGALLRDPVTPTDVRGQSIALGTVAASGTCLLLIGAERAGGALLTRHRSTQWEREWVEVDTQWGRREA
ncbi:hypothetical protein [Streptomyces sp. NPDC101393]|uniref:Rv1733c family protein n=1 Tax=Streptomyces sp. NPDC101393 TaxID=3366141 RepID=UPI003800B877